VQSFECGAFALICGISEHVLCHVLSPVVRSQSIKSKCIPAQLVQTFRISPSTHTNLSITQSSANYHGDYA